MCCIYYILYKCESFWKDVFFVFGVGFKEYRVSRWEGKIDIKGERLRMYRDNLEVKIDWNIYLFFIIFNFSGIGDI